MEAIRLPQLDYKYKAEILKTVEKAKALMSNSTFVGELALQKPLENKEETKKKIAEWCNAFKIV